MLKQRFQILKDGFRIRLPKNIGKQEERFESIHRLAFLLCGLHNMLKDFEDEWKIELEPSIMGFEEDDDDSTQDEADDEQDYEDEDEEPLLDPQQAHISQLPDFQRREEGERLRTEICREVDIHKDSIF